MKIELNKPNNAGLVVVHHSDGCNCVPCGALTRDNLVDFSRFAGYGESIAFFPILHELERDIVEGVSYINALPVGETSEAMSP